MRTSKKLVKYAFYGLPGSGKSTSVQLLIEKAKKRGWWVRCIKFATPLYEAQRIVYELAGRPLVDNKKQDGKLLNFLGGHFRAINASALTEYFSRIEAHYIQAFCNQKASRGLVLNDDMRASEASFLRSKQYLLVQVEADPNICTMRRSTRGDLTLGSLTHKTEDGLSSIIPDISIKNTGSLSELGVKINNFFDSL